MQRVLIQKQSLLSRFRKGALAGAGATFPMTITLYVLRQFLMPDAKDMLGPDRTTRWIEAQLNLDTHLSRHEHWALMLLAHSGYGALAGMVYAPFAPRKPVYAIPQGIAFGLFVWATAYMGWLPVVRVVPSPPQRSSHRRVIMISAHVVWGAVLGALLAQMQETSASEYTQMPKE
jgi:uncharacterized membrane protein YagU involved in acid resistance